MNQYHSLVVDFWWLHVDTRVSIATPTFKMNFNSFFNFLTLISIGLILSYYWSSLLQNYYFTRIEFSTRPKLLHDVSLFSEGGFYYSFYQQFASAKTWKKGLELLTKDGLSEYPDTINSLVI
jgi:hypothetical protein